MPDQETPVRARNAPERIAAPRIGVAAFAPDGGLILANEHFAQALSLDPGVVVRGLAFQALLAWIGQSGLYDSDAAMRRLYDVAAGIETTVRCRHRDGTVLDIAGDPLADGGWTLTVTDVSQPADEARLRAALLDSILENVPHGICVYGPDRKVKLFNRTYVDVMQGAPLAVGDDLRTVISRRAKAGEYGEGDVDAIIEEQLAHDIGQPQMRRRRRPNGTAVDVRTAPLPDGGHISVVTDVTKLSEAEADASCRAEQMAVMLDSIRHGITLWSADRTVLATNDIAAELLGHPPGVLVPGRTMSEIVDQLRERGELGDGDAALARVESLTARDWSDVYTRELVTAAGRVLEARSDPTPEGGFVSTFTDITEVRATEQELRRAKEAAETANRAKSRFLATMSHELRTPLNAIIGFSDALLREGANPDPLRVEDYAEQVNQAGRQLLGLINSILDVSRIEAGRFELADDVVDLARMVNAAVHRVDASAQAAEIALVVAMPDGLPPLRADERRLAQALAHLLNNAIKFTEPGGTVTVDASRADDGALLICVTDTGIGIPEADLERVFEPFIQLDASLSRRFEGSGLGLYISRALVQGHGGQLVLRSQPLAGTTAEIRMPAERLVAAGPRLSQEDKP